jgi:DNA-binding Lrp family transcriptional regulator
MKTANKVVRLIQKNVQISVHELSDILKISRQYIHKVLLELEQEGIVKKIGMAPKVYYTLSEVDKNAKAIIITHEQELFLQNHFIIVNALGQKLEGLLAMDYWCEKLNLPVVKTIEEFLTTRKKYLDFYNEKGLIDGLPKLKSTKGIEKIGVDFIYYLDFYAIERFGKTRLGTLMHYAKQGQNRALMKIIVNEIRQRILKLIDDEQIDALVFVPPTISRKIQIMDVLQKLLTIDKPILKVEKIKTQIIVPQKALSKIFERVANAKNTFVIPNQKKYNHILIIDDAVGSGATINEIALKIKEKKIANTITGLAISGSYKGFEVISEL